MACRPAVISQHVTGISFRHLSGPKPGHPQKAGPRFHSIARDSPPPLPTTTVMLRSLSQSCRGAGRRTSKRLWCMRLQSSRNMMSCIWGRSHPNRSRPEGAWQAVAGPIAGIHLARLAACCFSFLLHVFVTLFFSCFSLKGQPHVPTQIPSQPTALFSLRSAPGLELFRETSTVIGYVRKHHALPLDATSCTQAGYVALVHKRVPQKAPRLLKAESSVAD